MSLIPVENPIPTIGYLIALVSFVGWAVWVVAASFKARPEFEE